MVNLREEVSKPLEQLLEEFGGAQPGSPRAFEIELAIKAKSLATQLENLSLQKISSQASIDAANATKRTAIWTMVSGIAIAVSAAATVFIAFQ